MINLKCQCCGLEQTFENEEEAFQAGWDAPPHFTTHICCNLCPGVCVVLSEPHTLAHALWEKEGRPKTFTVAKCGTDKDITNPKEAERKIAELKKKLDFLNEDKIIELVKFLAEEAAKGRITQ